MMMNSHERNFISYDIIPSFGEGVVGFCSWLGATCMVGFESIYAVTFSCGERINIAQYLREGNLNEWPPLHYDSLILSLKDKSQIRCCYWKMLKLWWVTVNVGSFSLLLGIKRISLFSFAAI
ncbi:uncharacterized protein LOC131335322 [Rhododendron vialii]|uniref:uncharacterized protein LOC131335322 n=1 Tax=Rhododendron vialii TaxID=182163 RepID=UPI00265EC7C8|nr:uncharacterized protein LOC131335322 [Rhododendron vialii]